MKVTFNLNDNVRVKITEAGYSVWEKFHRDLRIDPPDLKAKTDPDGRHTFQMHEVMMIFGPQCFNGSRTPIETEVEIKGATW